MKSSLKLVFLFGLTILFVSALQGVDPYQQKPADVEAYEQAEYAKILTSPKPVYGDCQPFYKRLFYNIDNVPSDYMPSNEKMTGQQQDSIYKTLNLQRQGPNVVDERPLDMYIYFNTNISCPRSYVTIQVTNSRIFRFDCQQQLLHLEVNGSIWEQFNHKCRVFISVQQASFIASFKYTIYGQVANLEDKELLQSLTEEKVSQLKSKIRTSQTIQVEVVRKEITTKMIVLGDWAPIKVRPYLPIHDSLSHLIDLRKQERVASPLKNQYRITALVIAGDMAYNLEDFNGMKYNWFMSELQRVSAYWPIILCPGNHDDVTPGNRYLQSHSFEIGRLGVQDGNYTRVKWMRFPQLINFVMFDPFWEIYNKATEQQTSQMTNYLKSTLNQIQQKYPNEFVAVMSHYPIACSQMDDNHCNGMLYTKQTKDLLDFMSVQRNGKPRLVDLYIGSHMHQFERVFPYANGTFEIGQKYTYPRGHMVSVLEGAAGCDYGMISTDFPRQNFSVSATYAKTGYAVMTIYETSQIQDKTKYKLNYLHLAAKPAPDYFENIDQFTIYGKVPQNGMIDDLMNTISKKAAEMGQKVQQLINSLESNFVTE